MVRLLTIEQLAAELPASKSWLYEQTRAVGPDTIPAYKIGKRWMFDLAEVLDWLRQTRRHSVQPVSARPRRPAARRLRLVARRETGR